VVDHLLFANDTYKWNITFIRSMHVWEIEMVTSFFNHLYSIRLNRGSEDRIYWLPFKRQTFEVRFFYHALNPLTSISFPCKSIWENKAPKRVSFFV
jgi:hypothetical protein